MTKEIKKLAFVGNFTVDYSSENHYLRALRKLGIEVVVLQERVATGEQIEQTARECDALFWVHTHGWVNPGKPMRDVLLSLKYHGVPTFGYHLDLWMGLAREKDLLHDDYWLVDYFFTVDKLMAEHLNKQPNAPKAFFIRAGVVEDECYHAPIVNGTFPEIVFVGSKNYHPEWPYRPLLVNWLQQTYGDRFAHYGPDGLGIVRGDMLNRVCSNSKIVIGDTLCIGYNYPYYMSDRIFEITGRGGFMIHPYIKGIDDVFEQEKEIICYEYADFKGLKERIDYFLDHDKEREAIRKAGQRRTKKDHTYTQRLARILEIVSVEEALK